MFLTNKDECDFSKIAILFKKNKLFILIIRSVIQLLFINFTKYSKYEEGEKGCSVEPQI